MAMKEITVQVPEHMSALADVVMSLIKDVKGKDYGMVFEDILKAVQAYNASGGNLAAEIKDPAAAVLIGLAIGQIVQQFLPAQAAVAGSPAPAALPGA